MAKTSKPDPQFEIEFFEAIYRRCPDYIEVVFLRPFQVQELAKTGDAEKRMLLVDYGLKVNHEAAHGVAADLS